jgi:predicted nuclease with TOPRIM domain
LAANLGAQERLNDLAFENCSLRTKIETVSAENDQLPERIDELAGGTGSLSN